MIDGRAANLICERLNRFSERDPMAVELVRTMSLIICRKSSPFGQKASKNAKHLMEGVQ